MNSSKVLNFSPGPSKLPEDVLKAAQAELLDYAATGISVMEMSHRSAEFGKIIDEAQEAIQRLLNIPSEYRILFMAGGGTGQFSAVPLNLINKTGKAVYLNTGTWSAKAAKEASKYGTISEIKPSLDSLSPKTEWALEEDASYFYYCSNETVHGVELDFCPKVPHNIPVVADMSSNILTKDIDITKFGLVFAGAQKNIGPAGVTLVIIREDLLGNASPCCPTILNYSIMANENSLHNTPPCWNLYVMGLVLRWVEKEGGVTSMEQRSAEKSRTVYDAIDSSAGFYTCPIPTNVRSRVNIPFRIRGGDENFENQFIQEAKKRNMIQLKGHRSVGGIRVSLYNAVSVEEVALLVRFMAEFMASKSSN